MTARETVFEKLGLRTQPFFPEIGQTGAEIKRKALQRELDPRIDEYVLNYYYDVYDWSGSTIIGGLSPTQALQRFPAVGELPMPLMILVSGIKSSGRDSLINLIALKVQKIHGEKPFILKSKIGVGKESSVKQIATDFKEDWSSQSSNEEMYATLEGRFAANIKQRGGDGDAFYTSLFRAFRNVVRKDSQAPIVFVISGWESFDIWRCVYNSCNQLFDYLIVQTANEAAASACLKVMTGVPTVHINAKELSEESAVEYARARIFFERRVAEEPNDLTPLTLEAIRTLYKIGTNAADKDTPLLWPIGWIRETLRVALDQHIEHLSQVIELRGERALDQAGPQELLIGEKLISRVREYLNGGGM